MSRPESISIISEIFSTPIAYRPKKNYYGLSHVCVETIETTPSSPEILTISQKDQKIYHGPCLDGKPNGITCEVFYPSGTLQYQGGLSRGLRVGYGVDYYDDGEIRYAGNFVDDRYDGDCCIVYSYRKKCEGILVSYKLEFEGCLVKGVPEGEVVIWNYPYDFFIKYDRGFEAGCIWKGYCEKGRPTNRPGEVSPKFIIRRLKTGAKAPGYNLLYIGQMKDGVPSGSGKIFSGNYYHLGDSNVPEIPLKKLADWPWNDMMDPQLTEFIQYEGPWVEGKWEGKNGTLYCCGNPIKTEVQYYGDFKDNLFHGRGIKYRIRSTYLQNSNSGDNGRALFCGYFENGKPLLDGQETVSYHSGNIEYILEKVDPESELGYCENFYCTPSEGKPGSLHYASKVNRD
jgi:hypothetical protein